MNALALAVQVAISFLEPGADGKSCKWVKLEVGGARHDLLTFGAPCDDAEVAWNAASSEGLIFVPGPARGWRVDLASGKASGVAFTGITAEATEAGFDAGGAIIALVGREESKLQSHKKHGKKVFAVDGATVTDQGGADGIHGVALAYRLDGDRWKRVEAKFTTFGWDYAAGVHAVEIAGKLGPTSISLEEDRGKWGEVKKEDAHTAELEKLRASGDEGMWAKLESPAGTVFFYEESAEISYPAMPVRWLDGDKLAELPGLDLDGAIVINVKEGHLLIKKGGEVRLYNLRGKKKLFAAGNTLSAVFWP
jgi:hypothetical protein